MGEQFLYEDLTHKIIGCSHSVFKALGYGHREKVFQRAFAEEFKIQDIKFDQELAVPISHNDKIIARYYLDFLVEDKVVVEIKVAKDFYTKDIKQVLSYLKSNNYRLGLLMIVTPKGILTKRIIN